METRRSSEGMAGSVASAMRAEMRRSGAARRRTAAALLGLALGVLLGFLYAPRSRWMLFEQARRGIFSQPSGIPATDADILFAPAPAAASRLEGSLQAAALARPDDGGAQTAITVMGVGRAGAHASAADAIKSFLPLLDRFPNTPEVHAAALRLAGMRMARRDAHVPAATEAWTLDHFARIAKRGEALDPGNAFFPMMRSAALYAAGGHEAEARAALAAAAARPEWRDGVEYEVQGAWRLSDRACGAANPAARAMFASRAGLGYDILLRRAAGSAVAQAEAAARVGRSRDGDTIRRDLLQAGGRMRAEASTLNIALAGIAMQRAALQHDPTAPPAEAFMAPMEGAWMVRQVEAQGAVVRIAAVGLGHLDFEERLRRYSAWFALGQALLAGAFWTALLGAVAWFGEGFARNTALLPERRARERGVAALVILLAAGLALSAVAAMVGPMPDRAAGIGKLVPAIVLAGVALSGRRAWPMGERLRRAFPTAALPVACALILAYGGVTLLTLRQAEGINRGLSAMVHHEGRFYAGLTDLSWPEY